MAAGTYPNSYVANPEQAEAIACEQALILSKDLGSKWLSLKEIPHLLSLNYGFLQKIALFLISIWVTLSEESFSKPRFWLEEAPSVVEAAVLQDRWDLNSVRGRVFDRVTFIAVADITDIIAVTAGAAVLVIDGQEVPQPTYADILAGLAINKPICAEEEVDMADSFDLEDKDFITDTRLGVSSIQFSEHAYKKMELSMTRTVVLKLLGQRLLSCPVPIRTSQPYPSMVIAWIRFPRLPEYKYHEKILYSIGKLVGKVIAYKTWSMRIYRPFVLLVASSNIFKTHVATMVIRKFTLIQIKLQRIKSLPVLLVIPPRHLITMFLIQRRALMARRWWWREGVNECRGRIQKNKEISAIPRESCSRFAALSVDWSNNGKDSNPGGGNTGGNKVELAVKTTSKNTNNHKISASLLPL
ncbi:hypothetical protein F3Y22_tig00117016pilonHSYRG00204 [Hibiscus syriacus]|uniref:Uncharacterized protein n=1 Tax=Hibiscus syriacus TaxID=106335 RepID=A0A6A2WCC9_HIBSY|nr:hypothetical protein F3Y22_tig00117016pilonHSYRG00204 [Hibiscus syriacus]